MERFEPIVVDGLLERLRTEKDGARRLEYAAALTRVCNKPGAWVYWGFRPAPRPANTVAWERTEAIADALNGMLADPDRAIRLAILRRLQREKVPVADYYPALSDAAGDFRAELNSDGVHPNLTGYRVMEPITRAAVQAALSGRGA